MTTAEARVAIENLCPTQPQVLHDPESAWPWILSGYDKDGNFHYGAGAGWDEAWAEVQGVTLYPSIENIRVAADENNVG